MPRKGPILLLLVLIAAMLVIGCAQPTPTATPTQQPTTTTSPTSTAKPTTSPTSSPTATPTQTVQPIVLRANVGVGPKTYYWAPAFFDPWCDAIEQRSGGRIQFKRTYGSELFSAANEWNALNDGAIDVVPFMVNAYYASMSPLFTMSQVPFLWENARHFKAGLDNGLEKVFRDAVLEKFPNTVVLNSFISSGDTQIYYKGPDIKLPGDVAGRKLRVTDAILNNYINSLGGTGVFVPVAEAYTSMQRSIVTGALGQNFSLLTYKWYEVVDKAVQVKMVTVQDAGLINRRVWDSLPSDLQQLMISTTAELADKSNYTQLDIDQYTNNINDVKKAAPNFTFADITPEQRVAWRAAAKPTWDYYSRLGGVATAQVINIAEATRSEFLK